VLHPDDSDGTARHHNLERIRHDRDRRAGHMLHRVSRQIPEQPRMLGLESDGDRLRLARVDHIGRALSGTFPIGGAAIDTACLCHAQIVDQSDVPSCLSAEKRAA
jgi:hypothetical protein